jgi:hypothetical protein
MGEYSEVYVAFDLSKTKHAVAIADGGRSWLATMVYLSLHKCPYRVPFSTFSNPELHNLRPAPPVTCHRPPNMRHLVSIDRLSVEQRAKLVAASQEARPSEEYRIRFAALAQRRPELRADKRRGLWRDVALEGLVRP